MKGEIKLQGGDSAGDPLCFHDKRDHNEELNFKNLVLTTLNIFFASKEAVSFILCNGFLLQMEYTKEETKFHSEELIC